MTHETEKVHGDFEDGRSQQGYILCLGPQDLVTLPVAMVHVISWSSSLIRKICRPTLQAGTMVMTRGVEARARLRAAIVDMKGQLDINNCENSAASHMGHVCMTDCDSLYENFILPKMNWIDSKTWGRKNSIHRSLFRRLSRGD